MLLMKGSSFWRQTSRLVVAVTEPTRAGEKRERNGGLKKSRRGKVEETRKKELVDLMPPPAGGGNDRIGTGILGGLGSPVV